MPLHLYRFYICFMAHTGQGPLLNLFKNFVSGRSYQIEPLTSTYIVIYKHGRTQKFACLRSTTNIFKKNIWLETATSFKTNCSLQPELSYNTLCKEPFIKWRATIFNFMFKCQRWSILCHFMVINMGNRELHLHINHRTQKFR